MVDVRPFRGLRYSPERVGDLSAVISPPYDVISAEEQTYYYERSPYNIVRLEAGKERADDSPGKDKYTRAAATLRKWLAEGVLLQENRPAFYAFLHRFRYDDRPEMRRWSLLGRVRLEDWRTGMVCPHEDTLKEPARDRMLLLRSCKANISPIMALVPHGSGEFLNVLPRLAPGSALMEVTDPYGAAHSVWAITDEEATAALTAVFAKKVLYIADGHHRYETALAYRDEQRAAYPGYTGEEGFNFIMMDLVDSQDPGVVVLPTHRLVRCSLDGEDAAELDSRLRTFFDLESLPPSSGTPGEALKEWLDVLGRQRTTAFGLYGLRGKRFWLMTLREDADLAPLMPPGKSKPWKDLDVSILHTAVLQRLPGLATPDGERCCLDYTRDPAEALAGVNSGEYQLAFFLNPMPVSSILEVSSAGDRMPQKSTYFYPKPPAGLVINPLWD
ncbi:MAG: DUF1015 domain-containing protein [Chloroflexi bacterium]|nr:DUF1015 domain-containing protein [Chloroflexota bacterium]